MRVWQEGSCYLPTGWMMKQEEWREDVSLPRGWMVGTCYLPTGWMMKLFQ